MRLRRGEPPWPDEATLSFVGAREPKLDRPPGSRVELAVSHEKFGRGRVLELRACGERRRYLVRFDDGVERLIMEQSLRWLSPAGDSTS